MSDIMVSVEQVSKKFCRSLKHGMLYTVTDVARDLLGMPGKNEQLRPDEFWVNRDVSFELSRGECLGLIGLNGAGKSTLLKMLNGIIRPDKGRIRIRGRVGALIEVGAGFHPMLTGRENIYVNGAILGMSAREIDAKFDEIVEFSGLDSSILDAPVKSYSSGMYVRLGFAIAVHTDPDVLLIDEVLAVGDVRFTGRCRQKIDELRRNGACMVFVSHSLSLVEQVCNRGMLLVKGEPAAFGNVNAVLSAYRGHVREMAPTSTKDVAADPHLRLVASEVLGPDGLVTNVLTCGSMATLRVTLMTAEAVSSGVLSVWFMRTDDGQIAGIRYLQVGDQLPSLQSGDLELEFQCQLVPGEYKLGVTFSTDGEYGIVDEFAPCVIRVEPGRRRCPTVGTYMLNVWHREGNSPHLMGAEGEGMPESICLPDILRHCEPEVPVAPLSLAAQEGMVDAGGGR